MKTGPLSVSFSDSQLESELLLAALGCFQVCFNDGSLRNFIPLLQINDVLVLLSYDAFVLLKDPQKVLNFILKFVLGCAQVELQLMDVFIKGYNLVVFKDNELVKLADLFLSLSLLQLIAFKKVHQGVDIVASSLLEIFDDVFGHLHLLSLLIKLEC